MSKMLQCVIKSKFSLKYIFLGIFVIYVTITINLLSWISKNHQPERKIRAALITGKDITKAVNPLEGMGEDTGKDMEIDNRGIFENSMKRKRKILAELIQEYHQSKEVNQEPRYSFKTIGNISVFSAFFDDRLNLDYEAAVVRVLGISRLDSLETLVCRYTDKGVDSWVLANRYAMSENHDRTYGGFVYICNAPRNLQFVPRKVYVQSLNNLNTDSNGSSNKSVALDLTQIKRKLTMKTMERNYDYGFDDNFYQSDEDTDFDDNNDDNNEFKDNNKPDHTADKNQDHSVNNKTITNSSTEISHNKSNMASTTKENYKSRQLHSLDMQIPMETTKQSNKSIPNIAVCVPPLFGDIKMSDFIQFVEFHKLQKVSHFFFYTMNISTDLAKILKFYEDKNIATLIKWTLPGHVGDKIWNHGQIVAVQDCLHRTIGHYDYAAFLDIDEIIVPKLDSDWPEMIKRLHKEFQDTENSLVGGFKFKSAFFDPQKISAISLNSPKHVKLTFLDKTERNGVISSVRTKMLVQPEYIVEMGIHHVSVTLNMYLNISIHDVSASTALIHHYRPCTTVSDKRMICQGYVKDDSLLKFESLLVKNYMDVVKKNIKKFRHT